MEGKRSVTKICATKGCGRHISQAILDVKPDAHLCSRCFKGNEAYMKPALSRKQLNRNARRNKNISRRR